MSRNSKRTHELEQQLAVLLGKKHFKQFKQPCTGKYRGYYDHYLEFEDGSRYFVSMVARRYTESLERAVCEYQYFRSHRERLCELAHEVILRDNRQAVELGLLPVEFITLEIMPSDLPRNPFWIVLKARHDGQEFYHAETSLYYACRGKPLGSDDPEAYFRDLIARPDDRLGDLARMSSVPFTKILMGYLFR